METISLLISAQLACYLGIFNSSVWMMLLLYQQPTAAASCKPRLMLPSESALKILLQSCLIHVNFYALSSVIRFVLMPATGVCRNPSYFCRVSAFSGRSNENSHFLTQVWECDRRDEDRFRCTSRTVFDILKPVEAVFTERKKFFPNFSENRRIGTIRMASRWNFSLYTSCIYWNIWRYFCFSNSLVHNAFPFNTRWNN